MRIDFEDRSYFEINEAGDGHNIYLIIGSRQKNNPLELIVNSVKINKKTFFDIIKNVMGPNILEILKKEKENESKDNIEHS